MKIKLDENIPNLLVDDLRELGHDALSVFQQGMKGVSDFELWNNLQREQRFLITQDLDFSDVNKYLPGTHAGLLLVRLREPGRIKIRQKVRDLFASEVSLKNWYGAFVVLTDHKLRVKLPD